MIKSFQTQYRKKSRATITVHVDIKDLQETIVLQADFTWFIQKLIKPALFATKIILVVLVFMCDDIFKSAIGDKPHEGNKNGRIQTFNGNNTVL
jgi:hypothetical protein